MPLPEDKHIFQSGAELDMRSDEEKLDDHKFKELVSTANPVTWIEKPMSEIRKFPIYNQNGSGSCVAQTQAKELGIMRWLKDNNYVHFSATDIYQRRANKPAPGMGAADVRKIVSEGVTLEVLMPSQNMTDSQMDSATVENYMREVGKIFAASSTLFLPAGDLETVASVIQTTKKGVMVWFYFDIDEWTEHPKVLNPGLDLYAPATLRHSVTAVDFALINGKKCIIIEDSWGTSYGMAGQRIIDEDFFKARNHFASYLTNFRFEEQIIKPQYTFTKSLSFGMTDPDVMALQSILKYEALFPADRELTGYYGSITSSGLLQWQIKHDVAPVAELNLLQGRKVGPKTISKLNALYG